MLSKIKLILNQDKGMTLVETIIGVVLLGMASLMLMTGFMTAASLINEANKYKSSSASVATVIDVEDVEPSDVVGNVTITINGAGISGRYYTHQDPNTKIKYEVFIPNEIQEKS